MQMLAWVLQALLALLFLAHGTVILARPGAAREQLDALPYPSGFLSFIGVCELLGAVGLVLPIWTGVAPWLTPLAAAGLAIIMVGAVWTHASVGQRSQSGVTGLITLLLVIIVVIRWPLLAGVI